MESQEVLLQEQMLELLKKNPDGINQSHMIKSVDGASYELIGMTLNSLIQQNRIIVSESDGETIFKYRSEREAAKFRDLTYEDHNIYEMIITTGNNGISSGELKQRTKYNTQILNKILKKLEKKCLVKSLKPVNSKCNKKFWLSYDIEPSQEITGGIWCSNQVFDKDLISTITDKCLHYVQREKITSRKEILIYIKSTGLVKNELKEEDLQKIINLLIFDDKIEVIFPDISYASCNKLTVLLKKNDPILNSLKYKTSGNYQVKSVMNQVPCTYCPVFRECQIENLINPKDCEHMLRYLKLFKI
jgi:DNA-directed RNA polymerase III subunit RPC6